MDIAAGMKIIKEKWITKPLGFRVRFQKKINDTLVTEYTPDISDNLLDSDVVAWRYAWKLWMSTKSDTAHIMDGEFVNITVVDDKDNPVNYYATNQATIYNVKTLPAE
ncbi:hypothetical protein [Desulfobacter sp.]|uniref:hypothetical protein n=1 Tax=Desulfobacter sp. TaxID=2294 RepID=UPI003D13E827